MLAFVKGIVAYKDAERAIIEAGGIGYELSMSAHALAALPTTGQPAQVWTFLQVKEDGISLFGFSDPAEKELFAKLITVSGVGPKMAISALSTFKPQELVSCIAAGDITAISTISGVGKKTAQRIVLELQGALQADATVPAGIPVKRGASMQEASAALSSMGFSPEEISGALKGCASEDTGEIIRYALRNMGGKA